MAKGPLTNDVSTEGQGGYPISDLRKEVCVDLILKRETKMPQNLADIICEWPLFSCVLSVCSILLPSA